MLGREDTVEGILISRSGGGGDVAVYIFAEGYEYGGTSVVGFSCPRMGNTEVRRTQRYAERMSLIARSVGRAPYAILPLVSVFVACVEDGSS